MSRRLPSTGLPLLLSCSLAGLLLLAACKPPQPKTGGGAFAIAVSLAGPATVGNVPVLVEVRREGQPVLGARVEVRGDMTHAGMRPVIAQATEVGGGTYRADAFEFTMAGDWVLTAEVTTADGARARGELLTTAAAR